MKNFIPILLLFACLQLSAQNKYTLGNSLYGDLYLGLMFTGEYGSGSGGLALGYRFNDRHALGLSWHGFSEVSTSTTRSASGIGLQYRYELKRWSFDAGTGYVRKFRYTGDDPFPTNAVHKGSDPWYYRLGMRRQMRGPFYLGLSYAQSGRFILQSTNTDFMPPEDSFFKTRGVYSFTLNFGFLFQKRK